MLDVEDWEEGRIIPACCRQVKEEGMKNAAFLHSNNYTRGHNKVTSYIHWVICKHMGLQVADKYYEIYTWEGHKYQ
jgi:hypothetical protein